MPKFAGSTISQGFCVYLGIFIVEIGHEGKSIPNRSIYLTSKKVHTKAHCELCDEIVYNSFYLKRHKASVHGIIPVNSVKCQICPLFFKSVSSLEKHHQNKHCWKF